MQMWKVAGDPKESHPESQGVPLECHSKGDELDPSDKGAWLTF